MKQRRRRGGMRSKRARPTPKWLTVSDQIDPVARARCLMLLSVLSGETPVTVAITEARISRGRYYQLETRALSAMLRALSPGASEEDDAHSPQKRISQLEEKVRWLERARRRSERLLLMTRRLAQASQSKPKGRRTASTRSGRSLSLRSRRKLPPPTNSMPAPTGEGEP